jgi:NAD+ kinase
MNIAIYGRNFGNNFGGMAIQLFEELKNENINVYINTKFYEFIKTKIFYTPSIAGTYDLNLPDNIKFDFLISVGGDGTFLESATFVKDSGVPILGINTGRLGFLSYVASNNSIWAINQITSGNYSIDKRMLLQVQADSDFYGDINFCLNEFAVQKKSRLNMIKIKVYADDNYINTYWSDGLIVATPTGSTAYSLSCGGPIVVPNSNVILITPIANHNLTVRPLVVSAESEIKIILDSNESNVLTSLDYRSFGIKNIKDIIIKKANFYINFVNLYENNYFSTLREKLMWGIDLRN